MQNYMQKEKKKEEQVTQDPHEVTKASSNKIGEEMSHKDKNTQDPRKTSLIKNLGKRDPYSNPDQQENSLN